MEPGEKESKRSREVKRDREREREHTSKRERAKNQDRAERQTQTDPQTPTPKLETATVLGCESMLVSCMVTRVASPRDLVFGHDSRLIPTETTKRLPQTLHRQSQIPYPNPQPLTPASLHTHEPDPKPQRRSEVESMLTCAVVYNSACLQHCDVTCL